MAYFKVDTFKELAVSVFLLIISTWLQPTAAIGSGPNVFSMDIFQLLAADVPQENLIFSPASIFTSVALPFLGADEKNEKEIRTALRLSNKHPHDVLAQKISAFFQYAFEYYKDKGNVTLLVANRIFVNKNTKIKALFHEQSKKFFHSDEAENIDFSNANDAVQKINTWVEKTTDNKIKNLLPAGSITPKSSIVEVNAIYFKAIWLHEFDPAQTQKAKFAVNGKQEKEVDMMTIKEKFNYLELPDMDATALELVYKSEDLSMVILLPNKKDGLRDMEKKLAGKDLYKIARAMNMTDVEVFIPKFKIETELNLEKTLNKMGMKTAFTERKGNFAELVEGGAATRLSRMVHKAFIEVNEKGPTAGVSTSKFSQSKGNVKVFRADHPFMYAIVGPHIVYFAGHVNKL